MLLIRKILTSFFLIFILSHSVLSQQPVIESFSPATGPVGSTLTITGSGFSTNASANTVWLGTVKAEITQASNNSLSVKVPTGTGYAPISVTVGGKTVYSKQIFVVTYPGGGANTYDSAFSRTLTLGYIPSGGVTNILTMDMNMDGKPDIVASGGHGNDRYSINVFINNSSGGVISFTERQQISCKNVSTISRDIAAGDIDGDGKPDLAVIADGQTSIIILKNTSSNGILSFAAPVEIETGVPLYKLLIAEFNNDGRPDIVATQNANINFHILSNQSVNGNIAFATGTVIPLKWPQSIMARDMDGDGKMDLLATSSADKGFHLFRNNTIGTDITFDASQFYQLYNNFEVADMDGDGKQDIITRDFSDGKSNIAVMKNNSVPGTVSLGAMQKVEMYGMNAEIMKGGIADLNGDGKPDFICGFIDDTGLRTIYNTSNGVNYNFAWAGMRYTIKQNPRYPAIADFDGDGKADIAVGHFLDPSITIFKNNTDQIYIQNFTPEQGTAGEKILVYGTNFKDLKEITVGGTKVESFRVNSWGSGESVELVLGRGASGAIQLKTPYATASKEGFNFIGAPTIESFTPTTAGLDFIVEIKGTNFSGVKSVKFGGVEASSFTVESLTLLKARPGKGASGKVSVTTGFSSVEKDGFTFNAVPVIGSMNPTAAAAGTSITISGQNFSAVPSENIVKFGSINATVTTASVTSLTVTVPNGAPRGSVTVTTRNLTGRSKEQFRTLLPYTDAPFKDDFFVKKETALRDEQRPGAAFDVNGDGFNDLILVRNNVLSVYFGRSAGNEINLEYITDITLAKIPGTLFTGDINGDGKTDLSTSANFVLINTSTATTPSFRVQDISIQSGGYYSLADVNDDGRPDIIVTYQNIYVYKNISTPEKVAFDDPTSFYYSAYNTRLMDVDGDGKPDIVGDITDPLDENRRSFCILRNTSENGKVNFAPPVMKFRDSGMPSFGDINGDGKPDLVYVNTTTSYVTRINKSTPGNIAFDAEVEMNTKHNIGRVELYDMNGDGKEDLILHASANYSSEYPALTLLKNNNGTSFEPGDTLHFAPGEDRVLIADFNGDNQPDLVFSNAVGKTLTILRNNLYRPVVTSFTPARVKVGDAVDIRGHNFTNATAVHFGGTKAAGFKVISANRIEAIIGEGNEGSVAVTNPLFTNDCDTLFFIPPVITGFEPTRAAAGTTVNIKGSGFSSIAAYNKVWFGSSKATVVSASATNLAVRVPEGSALGPVYVCAFGATAKSKNSFSTSFAAMGNGFTPNFFDTTSHDFHTVTDVTNAIAADFNGDGLPDIASIDTRNNQVCIRLNNSKPGKISFGETLIIPEMFRPLEIVAADFDGDGKTDIATRMEHQINNMTIYRNTTANNQLSFEIEERVRGVEDSYARLAIGDVDGDGKIDILAVSMGGPQINVVMRNISLPGKIKFKVELAPLVGTPLVVAAILADLDGDDKPESLLTSQVSNGIKINKNISTVGNIQFDYGPSIEHPGLDGTLYVEDLDGDGKKEIITLVRPLSGGSLTRIYLNTTKDGKMSFVNGLDFPVIWSGKIVIADFDSDGKPDLASYISLPNLYPDKLAIFKNMSTPGKLAFADPVPYNADYSFATIPVAGDFDGDGRPDIATINSGYKIIVARNKNGEPSIAPNGANPVSGRVFTSMIIDSGEPNLNGQPYVQRHADIHPEQNAESATAKITLFFTQQEFDKFNAAVNHGPDLPKNPTDATGKSNLRVYKYGGVSEVQLPGTYSGNGLEIDPEDADIIWNQEQQWWEISFSVNGFSGFYVSTRGFRYNEVPAPSISADYASFCQGGNVLLKASPSAGHQWYRNGIIINDANTNSYTTTQDGRYTVTATYNNKTSPQSAEFIVTAGNTPAKPVIRIEGMKIISNSISGNQWYQDGVLMQGVTSNEILPVDGHTYSVKVSLNGCVSPMSESVIFKVTGTIEVESGQFIRLAPNPVKTAARLDFRLNGIPVLNAIIVDMNGKVLALHRRINAGGSIDMNQLPRGLYVIRVTSDNGKIAHSFRVIKD